MKHRAAYKVLGVALRVVDARFPEAVSRRTVDALVGGMSVGTVNALEHTAKGLARSAMRSFLWRSGARTAKQREQKSVGQASSDVVFMLNFFSLWKSPVSSHVKLIADTANIYLRAGLRVTVVVTNHPFVGVYPGKAGFYSQNPVVLPAADVHKKIEQDFYAISGVSPGTYTLLVIGGGRLNERMSGLVQRLGAEMAALDITDNTLVLSAGGKYGSDFVHGYLGYVPGRHVLLMFNYANPVSRSFAKSYGLALSPALDRTLEMGLVQGVPVDQVRYRMSGFFWQSLPGAKLSVEEQGALSALTSTNPAKLLIVAKQQIDVELNEEFARILAACISEFDCSVLYIGAGDDAIRSRLIALGLPTDRHVALEFSENLLGLYSSLAERHESLFLLPRCAGGGHSTLFAALSGIPVVRFTDNDAEGYLPAGSFCESADSVLARARQLLSEQDSRSEDLDAVRAWIADRNSEVDQFFLDLVPAGTPGGEGDLAKARSGVNSSRQSAIRTNAK